MTRRYGQAHPRAVLTDHEVELLLALRADGHTLCELAEKFEVHKGAVAKICRGERRGSARDIDDAELQPMRVCTEPLPAVPLLTPGLCPGARAFELLAHALAAA